MGPLITLEAVQMVFRRINHGDLAAKSMARQNSSRSTLRKFPESGVVSVRSSLTVKPPDLKCWI